jgi:hypothetical protein
MLNLQLEMTQTIGIQTSTSGFDKIKDDYFHEIRLAAKYLWNSPSEKQTDCYDLCFKCHNPVLDSRRSIFTCDLDILQDYDIIHSDIPHAYEINIIEKCIRINPLFLKITNYSNFKYLCQLPKFVDVTINIVKNLMKQIQYNKNIYDYYIIIRGIMIKLRKSKYINYPTYNGCDNMTTIRDVFDNLNLPDINKFMIKIPDKNNIEVKEFSVLTLLKNLLDRFHCKKYCELCDFVFDSTTKYLCKINMLNPMLIIKGRDLLSLQEEQKVEYFEYIEQEKNNFNNLIEYAKKNHYKVKNIDCEKHIFRLTEQFKNETENLFNIYNKQKTFINEWEIKYTVLMLQAKSTLIDCYDHAIWDSKTLYCQHKDIIREFGEEEDVEKINIKSFTKMLNKHDFKMQFIQFMLENNNDIVNILSSRQKVQGWDNISHSSNAENLPYAKILDGLSGGTLRSMADTSSE